MLWLYGTRSKSWARGTPVTATNLTRTQLFFVWYVGETRNCSGFVFAI